MNPRFFKTNAFAVCMVAFLQIPYLQAMDASKDTPKRVGRSSSGSNVKDKKITEEKRSSTDSSEEPLLPKEQLDLILKEYEGNTREIRRRLNNKTDALSIPFFCNLKCSYFETLDSLNTIMEREDSSELKRHIKLALSAFIDKLSFTKTDNPTVFYIAQFAKRFNDDEYQNIKQQLSKKLWSFIKQQSIDLSIYSAVEIADTLTQVHVNLAQNFDNEAIKLMLKNKPLVCPIYDHYDGLQNILSLWLLSAEKEDQRNEIAKKIKEIGERFMQLNNGFGVLIINQVISGPATPLKLFTNTSQLEEFSPLKMLDRSYTIPQLNFWVKAIINAHDNPQKSDITDAYSKWEEKRIKYQRQDNKLMVIQELFTYFSNDMKFYDYDKDMPGEVFRRLIGLIKESMRKSNEEAKYFDSMEAEVKALDAFFKSWDRVPLWRELLSHGIYDRSKFKLFYEGIDVFEITDDEDNALMLSLWLNMDETLAFNLLKDNRGNYVYKPQSNESSSEKPRKKSADFGDLSRVGSTIALTPKPLHKADHKPEYNPGDTVIEKSISSFLPGRISRRKTRADARTDERMDSTNNLNSFPKIEEDLNSPPSLHIVKTAQPKNGSPTKPTKDYTALTDEPVLNFKDRPKNNNADLN